ncbi:MAG: nucleotidyltransferase domain-containing protein [Victivallaceae bacterium]|nr:nucleotidyltransferase domain-containing protein [Victivallaceae bacterium]
MCRNGMLVCESIPIDDERKRFIGLLVFNKNAFEKAKSEHRQYWEWRNHRNEARWRNQESGEMDYDAKNLMHTFRLLYSGLEIMRHGEPLVRFSGERLQELMDIRAGKFSYDELLSRANALSCELGSLRESSDLPESANLDAVNGLLLAVTEKWMKENAR